MTATTPPRSASTSSPVPLYKNARLTWRQNNTPAIPVVNAATLNALINNWRSYGDSASICPASGVDREAMLVSLGEDGWVLYVRKAGMERWGWPTTRLVSRRDARGHLPTLSSSDQWYSPSVESDVAYQTYLAGNIHSDPQVVAGSVRAWMTDQPLPNNYDLDRTSFVPIRCGSVAEAFETLPPQADNWAPEAVGAAVDLVGTLDVVGVLLRHPRSVLVQVASTGSRIHLEQRTDGTVRALGLTDDFGRRFHLRLPDGKVTWRERPRRR